MSSLLVRRRGAAIPLVVFGIATLGAILAWPGGPLVTRSADPTYAEDVAPIFFKNCTMCHRSGGQAPFSLLYYDGAAAFADSSIRYRVADFVN